MHKGLPAIILAPVLLVSGACYGQAACPWLNVATAAGLLGGPSVLSMTETPDHAKVCLFHRSEPADENSLRIFVAVMSEEQSAVRSVTSFSESCRGPALPVRGIGNDAVLCRDDEGKLHGEEMVGRVRNNVFTVTLRTAGRAATATNGLVEKTEMAAEQVAGNLF